MEHGMSNPLIKGKLIITEFRPQGPLQRKSLLRKRAGTLLTGRPRYTTGSGNEKVPIKQNPNCDDIPGEYIGKFDGDYFNS